MNDTIVIGSVITITICMLVLIYIFIKKIKKEKLSAVEEKQMISEDSLAYPLFLKYVDQKIKTEKKNSFFTLIWVNIDNFIEITDNYNEKDSDILINEIHYHLSNVIPKGTKIGYGPRKEAILIYLPAIYPEEQMITLAKTIKKASEVKVRIFEDITIQKTSTVSYATYPLQGTDAKTLINGLKMAIYISEHTGGNIIKPYSADMNKNQEYIDFYYELKQAIQKREFNFLYQPIVYLKDHKIKGFEALLRWNHKEKGLLTPDKFLNILENSGDINWIGLWGLETVVKTIEEIKKYSKEAFTFHINISLRQLLNSEVVSEFQKIITKYRASSEKIVLELLEFSTAVLQDEMIKTILKLKNIGFKLSVDISDIDFQILTKIEQYQIDIVKLDHKFQKIDNQLMKQKFLETLSQMKNITVVVEAIENKEQEQAAIKNNFIYGQGYYYDKPLEKIDLIERIK
ncbi:Diguanylate cyclase/phosphodiesterase [Alteracholeplasma palmae J233]|uniref:Diguanylate cyclase/phosphodiesterase n=1 Tax=Alteracholeplasma palmae (strain ATCC 49389 / J233) TaxID=1318466 RepID=U4KKJ4_ALTPJ|nr:GGDEF domain-containing phosphodiesterase [Alteracholeplasma palmae]CCV64113.1 Diguanylate cyclase/phosphodiesterase [Alteracholeplasma palmae J233]